MHSLNKNAWISLKISLKFIPKVQINNIPALVQIMAWRRSGDKPLSEPMMVGLPTHICVTRPQWVKGSCFIIETWAPFLYKDSLSRYGDLYYKDKTVVIFIMGISILIKHLYGRHTYTQMSLWEDKDVSSKLSLTFTLYTEGSNNHWFGQWLAPNTLNQRPGKPPAHFVKCTEWNIQATGIDAWASRVKCPARFVSHLHEICIYIYIWVVYSFCLFCCLFIVVTWWYVWCIEWASGNQEEVQACLVTLCLFIISCYS